jgi:hypothetical protein
VADQPTSYTRSLELLDNLDGRDSGSGVVVPLMDSLKCTVRAKQFACIAMSETGIFQKRVVTLDFETTGTVRLNGGNGIRDPSFT